MITPRRQGALSFIARLATVILVAAGLTMAATVTAAQAKVTNAVSTTTNIAAGTGACLNGGGNGDPINCNLYSAKEDVWLSGLPTDLADGDYFLAVLAPGGQNDPNDGSADLLSTDIRDDRTFSLVNGVITDNGIGNHAVVNGKIQLVPYLDTPNPGGEYILAVCAVPVDPEADVMASECKYDAFKIKSGDDTGYGPQALQVTKDANGAYDNTFRWTISKSVDQTLVKQVGGSATFNYTVGVGHDGGTISDVTVSGSITVHNPNTSDVTGVDVTDVLSDDTVCSVSGGDDVTIPAADDAHFPYSCTLSGLPEGQLDNIATATWPTQTLGTKTLTGDSADFTFSDIAFTENAIDDCVNVDDSYAGALGLVCVGDDNPTEFTYSRTIPVPAYDCLSYDNTATFTTNDTGATDSAGQTVTVCGPVKTGARTMGFWQNNNGQGIIKNGGAVSGVCKSATWLRQYAPFQDLSATATCTQTATYVTTVIKAANASGAAMNAMLKGQMLATALDVYFTGDGKYAGAQSFLPSTPIGGIAIDLTKVCKNIATCTKYENTSSAFGGATSLTVSQLLAYAASQSNAGGSAWYGQVKATQELAKDTFDAINNQVAFAP